MITESSIREALAKVPYPGFSRDIVSFGLVKGVHVEGSTVVLDISLATRDPNIPQTIEATATEVLRNIEGVEAVQVNFDLKEPPAQQATGGQQETSAAQSKIPGIKKIIAVASGKGGVGKSTVSANLAIAIAQTGATVGLCDCDLYGPSIAHMMGTTEQPMANEKNEIIPVDAHGIKVMSMGLLLGDDSPAIVRGPLATRYTQQFLRQTAWGELDYLVLDLPPGTGDIQLTIVQTVALNGAIIVTTPQEVALIDARKAVSMFQKVNVPISGIVENMAWFECDHGTRYPIFGEGGGQKEADRLGIPLLAQIPLDPKLRERADAGRPIAADGDETFSALAAKVI